VEHGLGGVELGDGWEDPTSIASQEDNVAGVICRQTRNLGVLDVFNRISTSGVFCKSRIVVVDEAGFRAENDVLKN
jgi:hypothetical protein